MARIITSILIIASFLGCADSSKQENNRSALSNISGTDTLKITARYADCGEWGGHWEYLYVYRSDVDSLMASYLRDTINCPEPNKPDYEVVRERWEKVLSNADQQRILSYVKSLFELSLANSPPGGNYFSVSDNSGALQVDYHSGENFFVGFDILKQDLY